mmetsp:Transcript_53468/g.168319  ORF Transcript_53468/g.168319 Transcript_53468/m.168319 type:complete len:213 (-) Transcript_53468:1169-1807(-)
MALATASTALPAAVRVWATTSPSPSAAAGAVLRPRAAVGSGGSGFLRPLHHCQTSRLPPGSPAPLSSAVSQPKASAPSASPEAALQKVQRPGIGTAARSSGCAGFDPTSGAMSAGTRQMRTAFAMPASSTSPAEPSSTANRVAGRLWGARTTPESTSLSSGRSSHKSDKWSRLSMSATSRGGSRWAATVQASSFMGSSTFIRACVKRFVGPA